MKSTIGALVLACLALFLLSPLVGHGQSKGNTQKGVTADVTFRNDPGDGITGAPTTATISSSGVFSLVDNADTGHLVGIPFDHQVAPPPEPYNCRIWSPTPVPLTFSEPLPSDLVTPLAVQIFSGYQFEYDSTHGWGPKVEGQTRKGPTYHGLNFLVDIPAREKRYVQMIIWLRLASCSSRELYELNFNRTWDAQTGLGGGILEVEAAATNAEVSTKGDTFYIRPIRWGQPNPLPYLGQDEASLRATVIGDSPTDPSGACMMGNYYMPFEITVVRR